MRLWPLLVSLSLTVVASNHAAAQDPVCTLAAAQVADCVTHYCPLTGSPARCNQRLEGVAQSLADPSCNAATVTEVRFSSCARLAGGRAGGQSGARVCERAAYHMYDCMMTYCVGAAADDPVCQAIPSDPMEDMPECTAEVRNAAEMLLSMSCEDLGLGSR